MGEYLFYRWPHFMTIKFNEYSIQMHWHWTQQRQGMGERWRSFIRKLRIIIVFIDMEFQAAHSDVRGVFWTNKAIVFGSRSWERVEHCEYSTQRIHAFCRFKLDRFYLSHLMGAFARPFIEYGTVTAIVRYCALFRSSLVIVYNAFEPVLCELISVYVCWE